MLASLVSFGRPSVPLNGRAGGHLWQNPGIRVPWLPRNVQAHNVMAVLPTLATLAWIISATEHIQVPSPPAAQEILRLEGVWNDAHLRGDVPALDALCATDLIVTVPGMKPMSKADILGFWQSGRARITRYDSSDVRVVVHGSTAVATGRLTRTRDFNGTVVNDLWRFTKTYSNVGGRWVLVAYHASDAPQ